jgi:hypothetical protein
MMTMQQIDCQHLVTYSIGEIWTKENQCIIGVYM